MSNFSESLLCKIERIKLDLFSFLFKLFFLNFFFFAVLYELFYSNYCVVNFGQGQADRQTESGVYEPSMQFAQVGSKFPFRILPCFPRQFWSTYTVPREGGTDPRKVRVGLDRAGKFKLYLYKCEKNEVLFYIFFMKKGVYSISFSSKIVETQVKVDNFAQNLVKISG